jgi:hypothetical protein
MMPNYRDFEVHCFNGKEDAREGALAVSKIEVAIPAKIRPFSDPLIQLRRRQAMVNDCWQSTPHRLTA